MNVLEIIGNVDNWITGLHPIDIKPVAVLVIVEEIIDVLENEQIGIGESSAPWRQFAVIKGFIVTAHCVSQRDLI